MSLAVGVIGTGVMGAEHARILRERTSGAHLAAVCDADPARAVAAARGARTFSDPHALIASDDVQALVIASPDATHAEYTLAAIEARKAVLCEKPIAVTAADGLRIVEAEVALAGHLQDAEHDGRRPNPWTAAPSIVGMSLAIKGPETMTSTASLALTKDRGAIDPFERRMRRQACQKSDKDHAGEIATGDRLHCIRSESPAAELLCDRQLPSREPPHDRASSMRS